MSKKKYWESFEKRAKAWDITRQIKWFWQRRTRGFDDRDLWNLDNTIIKFIYPRLEVFRTWQSEHGMSYPSNLDPAAWLDVLNEMVKAFKLLSDTEREFTPKSGEKIEELLKRNETENEQVRVGLELFAKYLRDLWD